MSRHCSPIPLKLDLCGSSPGAKFFRCRYKRMGRGDDEAWPAWPSMPSPSWSISLLPWTNKGEARDNWACLARRYLDIKPKNESGAVWTVSQNRKKTSAKHGETSNESHYRCFNPGFALHIAPGWVVRHAEEHRTYWDRPWNWGLREAGPNVLSDILGGRAWFWGSHPRISSCEAPLSTGMSHPLFGRDKNLNYPSHPHSMMAHIEDIWNWCAHDRGEQNLIDWDEIGPHGP